MTQRDRSGQLPPNPAVLCDGETPRPPWSPPIIQDKIVALAGNDRWQGLCEVDGYWSNYEIFVQLPEEWVDVRVRVENGTEGH